MLRWLKIENFKAFGRRQTIPLRPLTLVFGANSSGKSSILQALLVAKQTIGNAAESTARLAPIGKEVDVGDYANFVYRHEQSRRVGLAFGTDRRISPALDSWRQTERIRRGAGAHEECCEWLKDCGGFLQYEVTPKQVVNLRAFGLETAAARKHLLSIAVEEAEDREQGAVVGRVENDLEQSGAALVSWIRDRWGRDVPTEPDAVRRLCGEIDAARASYAESGADDMAAEVDGDCLRERVQAAVAIVRAGGRISEIASGEDEEDLTVNYEKLKAVLREEAARARASVPRYCEGQLLADFVEDLRGFRVGLPWPRASVSSGNCEERHMLLGCDLLETCNRVFADIRDDLLRVQHIGPLRDFPQRFQTFRGARRTHTGPTGRHLPDLLYADRKLIDRVNAWLERFGVAYRLEVREAADPIAPGLFSLWVVDTRNGVDASVRDVGVGVSQVLPVILETLIAQEQILCIEQPELHLHPKLQAELGSLFAECIEEPSRNQFVIETHSEHLILRIQRLVRTGKLDPAKVAVLHVRPGDDGAIVKEIRLDADGEFLDAWPDGFFEEGFIERFSDSPL